MQFFCKKNEKYFENHLEIFQAKVIMCLGVIDIFAKM